MEETIVKVETNIDDMNPEQYEYIIDLLLKAGANDVWLTPIIMKKGRPAILISVLCKDSLLTTVAHILFTHTTTIGLRCIDYHRIICERHYRVFYYEGMPVGIKEAYYQGQRVNISLEYEDMKRIAQVKKVSIQDIEHSIWKQIKL